MLERPVNSSLDRVYFPTTEGIIAVDPGDPRKHARYDPYSDPGDPARERTAMLGASDEVLYGRTGGIAGDFLIGVRTEEFYQTIDIECSLLQDFKYEATAAHDPAMNSDAAEPIKTPIYQVLLRVRQPTRADERDPANTNKAPGRPNERLRLEALGQALVGHAGREQVVSAGQPLDLRTDAQGRVRLTVTPGSYGADGKIYPSVSCPDLTLSVPFLDPALRFVFNPASYVMQDVAQVTADSLAQAKTYSGSFAVTESYRNNREALEAAAKSLNKAAGIVASSPKERRAPGAATGLLGPRCASGDADVRPVGRLRRRVTASEGFEFDLTPAHPMFHTLSPGDSGTLRRRSDSRPKRFLSADELWDRIKTGVLAVAEAVVEVVEDGVEAFLWCVEKGVEGVFELGCYALDTVEHACLFIQGIFDRIVDSIDHAIEFLSKIFDWDGILRTHDQISNTIRAGFDALQGKRPGMSFEKIAQTIEEHAADVQANVHDTFNSLKQHYGSKSGNMLLAGAPGDDSAVVPDSNDNTWLADKLCDSVLHQHTEQNLAARGKFTLGFELTEKMIEAINGLSGTLDGPAGRAAVEALRRLSDDLTALVNGDILGGALNLVLDLVEAVVDVILAISVSGARGLLKLIEAVLTAVEPLLVDTSLAEGIPFFSNFYGWLTGGCAPTLLDIISLVLAVPTHMGLRVVSELRSSIVTRIETYRPEQAVKRARTAEELPLGVILVAMGVAEVIGSIVATVIEGLWLIDKIPEGWEKIGRGFVLLLEFVNLGLKGAALTISWASENIAVNFVVLVSRVTCTGVTVSKAIMDLVIANKPQYFDACYVIKLFLHTVVTISAILEAIIAGHQMSSTADQLLFASNITGCVSAFLDSMPYSVLSGIIAVTRRGAGDAGQAALLKPKVAAAVVLAATGLLRVAGGAIDVAAGVVLLTS